MRALAPLRNGLHILKLRADADPTVSQTVNMMDRQMTHLVRLVDDLLDVSRITRGKLELRQRKVLLTEVLGHALESARAFIESQRHELRVDIRAPNLLVDGDPDRLAQVFSNLLLNAARYTEAGGHITLSLDHENGEAIIAIFTVLLAISTILLWVATTDVVRSAEETTRQPRWDLWDRYAKARGRQG